MGRVPGSVRMRVGFLSYCLLMMRISSLSFMACKLGVGRIPADNLVNIKLVDRCSVLRPVSSTGSYDLFTFMNAECKDRK